MKPSNILDRHTPVGQRYISKEDELMDWLEILCGTQCLQLHDAAPIDRLIYKDNTLIALAEVKARNLSLSQLHRFGSYLITAQKIADGQVLSEKLMAPFYLFVRLLEEPNDTFVWWQLTNAHGKTLIDIPQQITTTQKTCNGGETQRLNAFIPLHTMNYVELKT